jgi:hypothetical protein
MSNPAGEAAAAVRPDELLQALRDMIEFTVDSTCGSAHAIAQARELIARADAAQPQAAAVPIDMVLHCPKCGKMHVDAPDWNPVASKTEFAPLKWDNPPHRSHLCHGCGFIWRPADVPTNGVAALKTKGKNDCPVAAPAQTPPQADTSVHHKSEVKRIATLMGWTPPDAALRAQHASVVEDYETILVALRERLERVEAALRDLLSMADMFLARYLSGWRTDHGRELVERVSVARAALAASPSKPAPASTAEPVAWRHSHTHNLYDTEDEVPLVDGDEWAEPLYLCPTAQPAAPAQDGADRRDVVREIDLVLTDPDTTLSYGAWRTMQWLKRRAASPQPTLDDRADEGERKA